MSTIDKIERFYCNLRCRYNNALLKKLRFYSVMRYFTRCYANWYLPKFLSKNQKNPNYRLTPTNREQKIIVSFTSFPKRVEKLWLVVETIFRQSIKPDKLILWLSKEQFTSEMDSLPLSLTSLCERGLEIRFVDGDIRSHKKYYYTIKEYPNDILITIDDDIYYSEKLIETLFDWHQKFPEAVICKYAYHIKWNGTGKLLRYREWDKVYKEQEPSNGVFFGSGGGTLFPPHSLYKDVSNIDLAVKLCPIADDVFINSMVRLNGSKIAVANQNFVILPISIEDDEKLADSNLELDQNDLQIQNIRDYYIEDGKDLFGENLE